jgi:nucleoside-diphosphate-sugar epimerase
MNLIFGCGYLGRRVASRWVSGGRQVAAVTRSVERANELLAEGIHPLVADVNSPASLAKLPPAATVLFAVGYDRTSGLPIREVYVEGLRAVLAALPDTVECFIYVSSTGVFAQHDGQWVDEDSPAEPVREGGRACLEAERLLAAHPLGRRAMVLRMAGIYGPGRLPRRREIEAGESLAAPSEGYLNLIHVDDAAEVVLAAERSASRPSMYLVSDGHPVSRGEYYAELARLVGAPPPRFQHPGPDSPAAQRAESSKRISNARLLDELHVELSYPSYKEGLASVVVSG